jgi:hypothetical protein
MDAYVTALQQDHLANQQKDTEDIVEACYNTVSTSVTLQKKNVLHIDIYGLIGTQICRTFVLLLAKSRTFDYFIKPSYNAKDY